MNCRKSIFFDNSITISLYCIKVFSCSLVRFQFANLHVAIIFGRFLRTNQNFWEYIEQSNEKSFLYSWFAWNPKYIAIVAVVF